MAWFEEFFSELYGEVLASSYPPARTLRDARTIRRLLRLRAGQSVLDIPCGMGRIAIPLAMSGLRVTGVDQSVGYLRRARSAARGAGVHVRWVSSDMRGIDFTEEFDAAFNWFGSFGYFSNRDNLEFTRRVHDALRPGGRFLVEGFNATWLAKHHVGRWEDSRGGVHIAALSRWDAGTRRMRDLWTISDGQRTEQHRVSVRVFDAKEIRNLLREAGFARVAVFGYYPVGPVTRATRRMIAVAEKSSSNSVP